jgi:hypothetical protein
MKTLGAIAPNEKDILKRGGRYKVRKPNAIPGGGAMPLDRAKNKKANATSYSSQSRLIALQKTGDSRAKVFGTEGNASEQSGTSIFDPVLCELAYRWFCPQGGLVLDPFAGGSVRGIVAAKLGRKYVGIDLSARQIEANMEQAARICGNNKPLWHIGDSREIDALCPDVQADFIFSCPPYADLEVYSDNPQDLSTMPYPVFLKAYQEIIKKSCALLKENRFACFVIGEVRDSKGHYYQFVPDTIKSFTACGLKYYNEAILVTAVGSLPIRVGRQFEAGRKLGKTHQNVLVFIKGDAKKGTADIGPVEFGDISSEVLNAEKS